MHCGQAIFLRTAGAAQADPLLLIHGFPTASWDWEAVWPALAAYVAFRARLDAGTPAAAAGTA